MMPEVLRPELIKKIETDRSCRLITYIQSDRGVKVGPGTTGLFQMAGDLPRRFIDHLGKIGHVDKIGLFLYSRGGDVAVPWVLDNTIRKYCDQFEVIVPYRAHSAATMVTLGADTIVMGKHAELGPIDPTMSILEVNQEDPTKTKATTIAVEDITSFIKLAKEGMGLSDQAELGKAFQQLAEKVGPVALGTISRQQSYIRRVAGKLLELRKESPESAATGSVVESLITQAFFHQHAISREEAKKDFGLGNIITPDSALEDTMWDLYLSYESEMGLGSFIKVEDLFQPNDPDEKRVAGIKGILIESGELQSQYGGDLVVNRIRRPLPTVNLNLNLGLPPSTPGGAPQLDQNAIQQLQVVIQQVVQEELRRQAPITGYSVRLDRDKWETRPAGQQQ
jgi:hypothetical protein